MAVQTALTLNAVVHSPRGTSNGVSTWAKADDAAFGGATVVVSQSLRTVANTGENRVRVVLRAPINATEATTCACPGTPLGVTEFDGTIKIPAIATAAQRQDFRKRVKDYFASAEFAAIVDDLTGAWG